MCCIASRRAIRNILLLLLSMLRRAGENTFFDLDQLIVNKGTSRTRFRNLDTGWIQVEFQGYCWMQVGYRLNFKNIAGCRLNKLDTG